MITKHGWLFAGTLPNGKVVLEKGQTKNGNTTDQTHGLGPN